MTNQESQKNNTSSFFDPTKKILFRAVIGLLLLAGLGYAMLWFQRSVEANFAYQQEDYQPKCWFADESEVSSWGSVLGDSVVSRVWDFGDGVQDSGQVVSHLYLHPGTYQVTLMVTSKFDSNTFSREVTMYPSWELDYSIRPETDTTTVYFSAESNIIYPPTFHTNVLLYDSLKSLSALVRSRYELQEKFTWKLTQQDTAFEDHVSFDFPPGKHDVGLFLQLDLAWVDTLNGSSILPFSTKIDTVTSFESDRSPLTDSEKHMRDSLRKELIAKQLSPDVTYDPVPLFLSLKRYGVRYWPHIITILILLIYLLYEFRRYRIARHQTQNRIPHPGLKWIRRSLFITIPLLLFWGGYYVLHDPFVKVVTYQFAPRPDISISHHQNPGFIPFYMRIYAPFPDNSHEKNKDSVITPITYKVPHVGDYELIRSGIELDSTYFEGTQIINNRHLKKLTYEVSDSLVFINGKTNIDELLLNRLIRAEEAGENLNQLNLSNILSLPLDESDKFPWILDHFSETDRKLALFFSGDNDTIFDYDISPTFLISELDYPWEQQTINTFKLNHERILKNTIAATLPATPTLVKPILQANIQMLTLLHIHEDSLDYRLLSQLTSLEQLSFTEESGSGIYGNLFEINHLHSLKQLLFFGCNMLNLSELKDLTHLELLSLPFCDKATNITAINQLPKLKWISFPHNTSQQEFDEVIAGHPALEVVELFDCPHITDLRSLRSLYNLKGIIVMNFENEGHRQPVDYRALYDLKHLDFVHFPHQIYEDSIPIEMDIINSLHDELPQTSILAVAGLCLGSGWLLLVLPLTVIFYFFFLYIRIRSAHP